MAGKKSTTTGGLMVLVVIWICLVGFSTPAISETMNYKLYHYPVKTETALIGDVEGHTLRQTMRRGFFVIENGEVATWLGIVHTDLVKGSGSFKMYATITFSDSSTIILKAEGTLGGTAAALQTLEAKGEIIKGTGRFEGIKGTGTSTSKYLPLEKGEDAQKAIGEGTLNYTLPSK